MLALTDVLMSRTSTRDRPRFTELNDHLDRGRHLQHGVPHSGALRSSAVESLRHFIRALHDNPTNSRFTGDIQLSTLASTAARAGRPVSAPPHTGASHYLLDLFNRT